MSQRIREALLAAVGLLANKPVGVLDEGGRVSYPKSPRLSRADISDLERKRDRVEKQARKALRRGAAKK